MNVRMLPPVNVQKQTMVVDGRSYTAASGSYLDVPDFDAGPLEANGWTRACLVGPTSSRPSGTLPPYPAVPGQFYFDTTISKMIICDAGATWRDPASGSAV